MLAFGLRSISWGGIVGRIEICGAAGGAVRHWRRRLGVELSRAVHRCRVAVRLSLVADLSAGRRCDQHRCRDRLCDRCHRQQLCWRYGWPGFLLRCSCSVRVPAYWQAIVLRQARYRAQQRSARARSECRRSPRRSASIRLPARCSAAACHSVTARMQVVSACAELPRPLTDRSAPWLIAPEKWDIACSCGSTGSGVSVAVSVIGGGGGGTRCARKRNATSCARLPGSIGVCQRSSARCPPAPLG